MDLIVSNPPYVPLAQREGLQREVRDWEPHVALFAGETGFEIYGRIVADAPRVLRPGGWLVMELGFGAATTCRPARGLAGFPHRARPGRHPQSGRRQGPKVSVQPSAFSDRRAPARLLKKPDPKPENETTDKLRPLPGCGPLARGEPETENVGGGPDVGQAHTAGGAVKKGLKPVARRELVGRVRGISTQREASLRADRDYALDQPVPESAGPQK